MSTPSQPCNEMWAHMKTQRGSDTNSYVLRGTQKSLPGLGTATEPWQNSMKPFNLPSFLLWTQIVVFIILVSANWRTKPNFSFYSCGGKLLILSCALCNSWTPSKVLCAASLSFLSVKLHTFLWVWKAFIKHLPSTAVNFHFPTSRGTSKPDTYREHAGDLPDCPGKWSRISLPRLSLLPALFSSEHTPCSEPWGLPCQWDPHCLFGKASPWNIYSWGLWNATAFPPIISYCTECSFCLILGLSIWICTKFGSFLQDFPSFLIIPAQWPSLFPGHYLPLSHTVSSRHRRLNTANSKFLRL